MFSLKPSVTPNGENHNKTKNRGLNCLRNRSENTSPDTHYSSISWSVFFEFRANPKDFRYCRKKKNIKKKKTWVCPKTLKPLRWEDSVRSWPSVFLMFIESLAAEKDQNRIDASKNNTFWVCRNQPVVNETLHDALSVVARLD